MLTFGVVRHLWLTSKGDDQPYAFESCPFIHQILSVLITLFQHGAANRQSETKNLCSINLILDTEACGTTHYMKTMVQPSSMGDGNEAWDYFDFLLMLEHVNDSPSCCFSVGNRRKKTTWAGTNANVSFLPLTGENGQDEFHRRNTTSGSGDDLLFEGPRCG